MEDATDKQPRLAASAKRIFRRMLAIGGNRIELLLVELQEDRERFLLAILLAIGVATFSLLAGVALTVALVVLLWDHSPVIALLALVVLYSAVALLLYRRLAGLRKEWRSLPATLEQLRKDRECFEQSFN